MLLEHTRSVSATKKQLDVQVIQEWQKRQRYFTDSAVTVERASPSSRTACSRAELAQIILVVIAFTVQLVTVLHFISTH